MKHKIPYFGEGILLVAAMIWGTAFMFQSLAMQVMLPYTFVTARSFIATLVMGLIVGLRAKWIPSKRLNTLGKPKGYRLAIYAGLATSVAMILQQLGIIGTTSGKAGFLTVFYIIFVPFLGFLIQQHPSKKVWLGLGVALIGFYFLSLAGESSFTINGYDALILGCAFAYAFQIFFIDQVKDQMDSLFFSFVQFAVATVVTSVPMLLIEGLDFSFLLYPEAIYALLYVGIISSCLAYTLQIVGQKRAASAPIATLIMSLEAVFAVLAGMIFLQEVVTVNQMIGMSLIFLSIVVTNLSRSLILQFKKKSLIPQPGLLK
jgi:drug/metabolite transporter (DMT)-like permease